MNGDDFRGLTDIHAQSAMNSFLWDRALRRPVPDRQDVRPCDSGAQLPLIRELLETKGLSRQDADAVLGGNVRRVLRNGWR